MYIYSFLMASGFTDFYFPIEKDKEIFHQIVNDYFDEQKSAKDAWKTPIMLREEPKKYSDFFEIDNSGIIAINEKFFEVLETYFDLDNIELLPIETDAGMFGAINVLNIVDCLDLTESQYTSLSSGKISSYKLLDFSLDKVKDEALFKVPQLPHETFVSHEFLEMVEGFDVNGLEFNKEVNLIWHP